MAILNDTKLSTFSKRVHIFMPLVILKIRDCLVSRVSVYEWMQDQNRIIFFVQK